MNNLNENIEEKLKLLEEDLSEGKQKFRDKLYHIFYQEFEERIQNILVARETDFMYQYLTRMKLIIEDLYSNEAYEHSVFVQLMRETEKNIYEQAYKKSLAVLNKAWEEYERALNPQKVDNKHFRKSSMENKNSSSLKTNYSSNVNTSSTIIYLKSFRKHCKSTEAAIHKCKGKFIPIFDEKREITHVICTGCKSCFFSNSILMFCSACNVEYYSCYITNLNKNVQPATWEKYHCGAIINDQMHCIKCKDLFYINLVDGKLVCIKCKFEADPLSILWNCMLCHKDFKSNAKIYNPMEFKIIKIGIRNTILAKFPAKPLSVPCCKINVKSYSFFHKGECRGYLYQGEINEKRIIVCSKCKMMTNFEKFIWTCPICLKRFRQKEVPAEIEVPSQQDNNDYLPLKTEDNSNNNVRDNRNVVRNNVSNQGRDFSKGKKGKNISFSVNKDEENEDEITNGLSKNLQNVRLTPSKRNFNIVNPAKRIEIDLSKTSNNFGSNLSNNFQGPNYNVNTPNKKSKPIEGVNINLTKSSNGFFKQGEPNTRSSDSKVTNYGNYMGNNPSKISPLRKREDEDDEFNAREEMRPGSSAQNFYKKSISMANYAKPIEVKMNTPVVGSGYKSGVVALNPTPRKEKIPEFELDENMEYKVDKGSPVSKPIYAKVSPSQVKKIQKSPEKVISTNLPSNLNNVDLNSNYSFSTEQLPESIVKLKEFNFEEYNVITQIGEGSFGKIYLVEDKQKNICSMKKIIANDDVDLETFQSEYELVNLVRHPNIMRILAMCKRKLDYTTHVLYILMEVGLTDWEKEIKSRQGSKNFYSEKELVTVLKQLVSALAFLQTKDISHRDIKPQNVLLFKNNVFKIADFGEAKQISKMETNKQLSTLRGTELYMSPLLFNALRTNQNDIKHNSFKSDVFSLAFCIIYAASLNIYVLYELRKVYDTKSVLLILNKTFKGKLSNELIAVLGKMLEINEEYRYDFIQLEEILRDFD